MVYKPAPGLSALYPNRSHPHPMRQVSLGKFLCIRSCTKVSKSFESLLGLGRGEGLAAVSGELMMGRVPPLAPCPWAEIRREAVRFVQLVQETSDTSQLCWVLESG